MQSTCSEEARRDRDSGHKLGTGVKSEANLGNRPGDEEVTVVGSTSPHSTEDGRAMDWIVFRIEDDT
jgi:hypothetical protein